MSRVGLAREFYEGVLGLSPAGSHRPDVDVFYELRGGTRLVVVEKAIELRRAAAGSGDDERPVGLDGAALVWYAE